MAGKYGDYHGGSRAVEAFPECPECGFDMPVVGVSHPDGGHFQCQRCNIEFTQDADRRNAGGRSE